MVLNSVNVNNLTDLDQPRPCSPEQLTHSIHITLHYITLPLSPQTRPALLSLPYCYSPSPIPCSPLALSVLLWSCSRSLAVDPFLSTPMLFSTALALTQMPCLTLPCPSRSLYVCTYCTTYSLLPDQQPKIFHQQRLDLTGSPHKSTTP